MEIFTETFIVSQCFQHLKCYKHTFKIITDQFVIFDDIFIYAD